MRKILIAVVKIYKTALSPFLGKNCRFEPGCANYAMQAIDKHGAFYGSWLAVKRIGRCHPWHEGGYDPVPETK